MRCRPAVEILVPALLLTWCASPSWAAPEAVRLAFMDDGSQSVGVAWSTYSGTVETTVQYGTVKGSYPFSVVGQSSKVSTTLGAVSEATIKGLTPDTVYYYRVGGTVGGFSPEYSFRTAPKTDANCGKLSFVVFGDSRAESWQGDKGASDMWVTLSKAALKLGPLFLWHGGDIVYDGTKEKQWQNHLKATSAVSPSLPIMYVLGNHDDGPGSGDGANFNRLFNLPRASKTLGGSGTEDYFYFSAGNALFVVLSTESFSGGTTKFKEQADYMDKVFSQNPRRWRFVMLHRPIYTESLLLGHPPDEAGHNAALVPIINKHHVDMVFQSHNHFYERFVPSKCTNGASTKVCPSGSTATGTVFITTGGGGAFPIIFPGLTNSVRVAASGSHHFLHLQIAHHTLGLKVLDNNNKTIDSLTIQKTVPSPDPCAIPPLPDGGPTDGKTAPDQKSALDTGLPPDGKPPQDRGPTEGSPTKTEFGSPDRPITDRGASSREGPSSLDHGSTSPGADDEGCSCSTMHHRSASGEPGLLLLLAVLAGSLGVSRRNRRQRGRRERGN